jgi:hypothetical protein
VKPFVLVGLFILLATLWISSALQHQQTLGKDQQTVQAQITAVVQPTKTP